MRASFSSICEWIRFWIWSGLLDVGEALLAVLGAGLDQQVAGAEHPLDDPLAEVHAVDALERDLDAALGEHARDGRSPGRW